MQPKPSSETSRRPSLRVLIVLARPLGSADLTDALVASAVLPTCADDVHAASGAPAKPRRKLLLSSELCSPRGCKTLIVLSVLASVFAGSCRGDRSGS